MTAVLRRGAPVRAPGLGWLAGVLAVLVAIGAPAGPVRGEERSAVELRIANGAATAELRCQAVLARFMTLDLAPLAPGRALTLPLQRETATGTLLAVGPGGRLVPVENVLCGLERDWIATRNDLDLTPLRAGGTRQLSVTCTDRDGMSCTAEN